MATYRHPPRRHIPIQDESRRRVQAQCLIHDRLKIRPRFRLFEADGITQLAFPLFVLQLPDQAAQRGGILQQQVENATKGDGSRVGPGEHVGGHHERDTFVVQLRLRSLHVEQLAQDILVVATPVPAPGDLLGRKLMEIAITVVQGKPVADDRPETLVQAEEPTGVHEPCCRRHGVLESLEHALVVPCLDVSKWSGKADRADNIWGERISLATKIQRVE